MTARLGRLTALWCAAVVPLLTFAPALDAYELPKALALHAAAAVLWLAAARGGLAASAPVMPPLLLALGWALVATVTSPLPGTALFGEYTSYQGWLHGVTLAALLVALPPRLAADGDAARVAAAAALSLTAVALHALAQLVLPAADGGALRRAYGTAGNAYFLGTLLALGVPLAAGLAAKARRGWWLGCAAIILAGVLASGSRSALAAALAGGAIVSLRGGRRLGRPALIVAAVTLLGCGLLLPADRNPFPPLLRRIADAAAGRDARGEIWAMAGRLIRARPLTGHGDDAFATLGGGVQTPALWDRLWRGTPEKAHNELLQIATAAGLPALGAILWLLVVVVRAPSRAASARPALAALAGLGFTALFGWTTLSPQAVALPLAALLLARLPIRRIPGPVAGAVAFVLLASTLAHARFLVADGRLRAMITGGAADPRFALQPRAPFASRLLRAGDLLERRWLGATIAGDRPGRAGFEQMKTLTALYEGARDLNPLHPLAHSSLARLAAREGRLVDADGGYRRARALAPADAYLALEHGQVLLAAGREADGLAALREVAARYPGFAEPVGMAGYAHLKAGRTADAEALLRKSLTLDWHGNAAAAYAAAMNLATLFHRSRRDAEAAWAGGIAETWRTRMSP